MKDLELTVPKDVEGFVKIMPNPTSLLTIPESERNPQRLIDERISHYRNLIRKNYPTLSEERIQLSLDVFFGPFNFEEFDSERRYSRNESREIKTRSASIQHLMTNLALHAGSENCDPEFRKKVAIQLLRYQEIARSKFGTEIQFGIFWKGVMAEIAITKALLAAGCEVSLPNYQPFPGQKSFEESQVCQMDVDRAIDMVAVRGSDIFLIDAKGTRYLEESVTKRVLTDSNGNRLIRDKVEMTERQGYEWNLPSLRGVSGIEDIFREHPYGIVHKMTIIVPTSDEYLPPISFSPEKPVINSVRSFARLNSTLTTAILMGLDTSQTSPLGQSISTNMEDAYARLSA